MTILLSNDFGEISQKSVSSDIEILTIKHDLFDASVSLYGGQVLTWQPQNQHPVFWLSKTSAYEKGKAIRGGIPLCWPWFGPYQDGGNHGFARQVKWQLDDMTVSKSAVKLVISTQGESLHPLWVAPFKLQQTLVFSECFDQQMVIKNLSLKTIKFTSALHSYFAVGSPKQTQIQGLNQVEFDDKITTKQAQQDTLNACLGPLDRIYHTSQVQEIVDANWQRKIKVSSSNCQQWVLWNPGSDIAATMSDVHKHGEHEFVCLEAANTKWIEIAPQSSLTLGQKITLSPL